MYCGEEARQTERTNKKESKKKDILCTQRDTSVQTSKQTKKNSSTCLCAVNWRVEICIKLVALIGGLNKIARLVVAF